MKTIWSLKVEEEDRTMAVTLRMNNSANDQDTKLVQPIKIIGKHFDGGESRKPL